ncbi:MAG: HNH endonuclease [Acidobacteriota bacterium]|nr:HNH endonuclease [Acidobacteriota bacterium]
MNTAPGLTAHAAEVDALIKRRIAGCRVCKTPFEPNERKFRKRNFICTPCENAYRKDWAARRQASGLPVGAALELIGRRFWKKVDKGAECWLWTASRKPNNYGEFHYQGRIRHAHRVAFALTFAAGELPELEVCHHCDNPPCVNPAHLFLGTHQDNMDDKGRKGRLRIGSQHQNARLTEQDVLRIRREVAAGRPQIHFVHLFNVGHATISNVVQRKTWTHV